MEDAKERWSVTYTKHVKQKRKVYQDGFLDLYISTKKVKLYDDCEKLLECRILKTDEVVSSGETLTFNSYLVDVGDLEGGRKAMPDLNTQGRDKKFSGLPNSMQRQKLRNNSVSSDRKIDTERKNVLPNSPSQKIIRDFKKRELQKYGMPQSSPDTTSSGTTEWQVMYTAQVTQKAKKYHDGFLRLATCGSMGRQIKLFDETRKLLDSRFLRRDEAIISGESIAFAGYLVEVGECEENHKPLTDLNVQGNDCNIAGKSTVMHGQQNCIKSNNYGAKEYRKSEVPGYGSPQSTPGTPKSNITEWQVMYTTQVTQKAKKYHDGFLRITSTGSLQRQVMLYDDSRRLLNSRFVKKDEAITSGESIAFDAHLVDIGEPQVNNELQMDVNVQGNNHNAAQKTGIMHREQNFLKTDKSVVKGKPQKSACSKETADSTFSISGVQEIKLSKTVNTNKPLRDARQILSILQQPMAMEGFGAGWCTANSMMGQLSSTKGVEDSDAVVDVPDDSPLLMPDHGSCKNMNIGNYPDPMSPGAISTCSGNQISKDTETVNLDQPHLDVEASTNRNEDAFSFGISSSGTYTSSHGAGEDKRNSYEEPTSGSEMNGFPSFDLGF